MLRTLLRLLTLTLLFASVGVHPAVTQSAVDSAISFYSHGGAYCFRIAPSGTTLSEETEWTVMLLTAGSNHRNSFRIRSVDPGTTGLSGSGLMAAGRLANDVWKFDGTRAEFFERFADGMRAGQLRARIVRIEPANLSRITSERERAEVYLKFADKGSRVSFDKVPDLTPEELMQYAEYFPD